MLGEIVFGAKKAKPSICKKAFTFCTREMFAAGLGMGAQEHHASFFQIEMRLILCMLFFSVFFWKDWFRMCVRSVIRQYFQKIISFLLFPNKSGHNIRTVKKNITFFGIWLVGLNVKTQSQCSFVHYTANINSADVHRRSRSEFWEVIGRRWKETWMSFRFRSRQYTAWLPLKDCWRKIFQHRFREIMSMWRLLSRAFLTCPTQIFWQINFEGAWMFHSISGRL